MKFFIVEPSPLPTLIPLGPKYSPQDLVFKYPIHSVFENSEINLHETFTTYQFEITSFHKQNLSTAATQRQSECLACSSSEFNPSETGIRRMVEQNFNRQFLYQICLGKSQIRPQCIGMLDSNSSAPLVLTIRVCQCRHQFSHSPFFASYLSLIYYTEMKHLTSFYRMYCIVMYCIVLYYIVLKGRSLLPNALRPFQDLLCSPEFRYY